jgi:hypothetical protein
VRDLALPPAPPLIAPKGEPTPQERSIDELGGPLEVLSSCRYCWGQHPGACPFIRRVEWHPNGQVSLVVLKDRPDHEKLIVYPGEEEVELVKLNLQAISEAPTLKQAREIAVTLLKMLEPEK